MNVLRNVFNKNVQSVSNLSNYFKSIKTYHTLFYRPTGRLIDDSMNYRLPSILSTTPLLNIPKCGFKFKGVVHKRCKDCYIVVKDRQKIVLCTTHKRHKQKEIMPKEKDTWIITHRTQGKIRPW